MHTKRVPRRGARDRAAGRTLSRFDSLFASFTTPQLHSTVPPGRTLIRIRFVSSPPPLLPSSLRLASLGVCRSYVRVATHVRHSSQAYHPSTPPSACAVVHLVVPPSPTSFSLIILHPPSVSPSDTRLRDPFRRPRRNPPSTPPRRSRSSPTHRCCWCCCWCCRYQCRCRAGTSCVGPWRRRGRSGGRRRESGTRRSRDPRSTRRWR